MKGNSRNAGTAEQRGEILLDVIGQRCPLPVLRARKRLLRLEPGQLVRVFASDPVARIDMPHFCVEAGHELVEVRDRGSWIEFLIRRGENVREPDDDLLSKPVSDL
ncbi:MAG TPA: sulfurtransferase TusA family protein [Rhodobiaceae bacterium]|nr:sulfurtransferase TusA family protein [Rhodobiaceae bacterium]